MSLHWGGTSANKVAYAFKNIYGKILIRGKILLYMNIYILYFNWNIRNYQSYSGSFHPCWCTTAFFWTLPACNNILNFSYLILLSFSYHNVPISVQFSSLSFSCIFNICSLHIQKNNLDCSKLMNSPKTVQMPPCFMFYIS